MFNFHKKLLFDEEKKIKQLYDLLEYYKHLQAR